MSDSLRTERTTVKRLAKRALYDRSTVEAIVDEAYICHVGFVVEGRPVVIPTAHVRHEKTLYIHGSAANRMLRTLAAGGEACVTITHLDGLVLARSAFHHSMNYRSVVLFGQARVVEGEEKEQALSLLVEKVEAGRSRLVREANAAELKQTLVLAVPINEASAKVRSGPPLDDEEDYKLDVWAGVIPLELEAGEPLRDAGPQQSS
jgi:nitroimidazol reductase NimA-like FMN-containing flavoprotein (pyridoxamine 5'-phosphate oxidase superfamily)